MKAILLSAVFLLSFSLVEAQKKTTSTASAVTSYDQALYAGIRWRELGPFRGGRSTTVTGIRGNNNVYYFGGVGGGVWKTEDAGQTWSNISDAYFGGTIGAVAVAESDPNVIYVGEGEQGLRNNVSSGWGLWKSTDAG
ncbi:MAG: glycosyl hydrolase, partial [Cyclobacteriaceae bacterium]|nr:glycosyl hydrolase [Cyclobacteriaceae bacterium]